MSNKIKLLYFSDFSLAKTGFGRAAKSLLEYLYNTGKFEIFHASMMKKQDEPDLAATPWESIGTFPDNENFNRTYGGNEKAMHTAGYGVFLIDKIVKEVRPQVILAAQDLWGTDYLAQKPYWNKIPCILWVTLDSLPIQDKAYEAAKKCAPGNFWVWSNFAERAMKENGCNNVKTVHAPFTADEFHRLEKVKKIALRKRFNIDQNDFIIIDVFRNQYRKSVFSTLEGYSLFKKDNPGVKSKLLLHTCFSEPQGGWNIMKQAEYYKVPKDEILTTYICGQCLDYEIKPFVGERQNCPYCKSQQSQFTANPRLGVSEEQLNEIYNLADITCHPANSGGLEIILVESLLCELPSLTTNYSYGEEFCNDGGPVIPLEFEPYRDLQQNEFIKAATKAKSVSKQLSRIYRMSEEERRDLGRKGRQWAVERYAVENAAKKIEGMLLEQKLTEYDFNFESRKPNPEAQISEIEDDTEWLRTMYRDILAMPVDEKDKGLQDWLEKLKKVD